MGQHVFRADNFEAIQICAELIHPDDCTALIIIEKCNEPNEGT